MLLKVGRQVGDAPGPQFFEPRAQPRVIELDHREGRLLEEQPVALLALAQGLLGFFQFGDFREHEAHVRQDHACRRSVRPPS